MIIVNKQELLLTLLSIKFPRPLLPTAEMIAISALPIGRYIGWQIWIAADNTITAKYACRDRHQRLSLMRSDMRLAVVPRLRSLSTAATPANGKDRHLGATDQ